MANHPTHPDIQLLEGKSNADDAHPHFTWMRKHAQVYRPVRAPNG